MLFQEKDLEELLITVKPLIYDAPEKAIKLLITQM